MIRGGENRVRYVVVVETRDLLEDGFDDGSIVGATGADARLSGSWK